jgi:hypothetical protein
VIDIYFFGEHIVSRYDCNYKKAEEEILSLIKKKYQGILTIDAGSLGVINLEFRNEVTKYAVDPKPNRISNWLSVFTSSLGQNREYIGLNSNRKQLRTSKNFANNIAHTSSPIVLTRTRAMTKGKKG